MSIPARTIYKATNKHDDKRAVALTPLRQGSRVIAVGRAPEKLAGLAAALLEARARLVGKRLGICDGARLSRGMAAWTESWGRSPISSTPPASSHTGGFSMEARTVSAPY